MPYSTQELETQFEDLIKLCMNADPKSWAAAPILLSKPIREIASWREDIVKFEDHYGGLKVTGAAEVKSVITDFLELLDIEVRHLERIRSNRAPGDKRSLISGVFLKINKLASTHLGYVKMFADRFKDTLANPVIGGNIPTLAELTALVSDIVHGMAGIDYSDEVYKNTDTQQARLDLINDWMQRLKEFADRVAPFTAKSKKLKYVHYCVMASRDDLVELRKFYIKSVDEYMSTRELPRRHYGYLQNQQRRFREILADMPNEIQEYFSQLAG